MKFLTGILGIIVAGFIVQSFFAWWSIAIVAAFFGAFMNVSNTKSYLLGFLGVSLLWGTYAAFLNAGNDGILATKIGTLFGGLSPLALIATTAVLGGIVGGFSALTGKMGRAVWS